MNLELGIKVPGPEGVRKVFVSFPSDADVATWRRAKSIVQKDIGRRQSIIEATKPGKEDLDLYRKIRRTGEDSEELVELDESESNLLISKLLTCDVPEAPEREGSTFLIRMRVMDATDTVHVLKVPTVREMMDYERTRSSVIFGQYGRQEIRINYRAAGEFYDKLLSRVEGYEDNKVPVHHKAEALNELLQAIRAEQEEEPVNDPE